MKSDKKLSPRMGLTLAMAIFSAAGLATFTTSTQTAAAAPVVVQDKAYAQDTIRQEFDLLTLDPKRDRTAYSAVRNKRSEFESRVTAALQGGAMTPAQRSEAGSWLTQVILAEMTQDNPDVLVDLGNRREDFMRRYVNTASAANRQMLIEQIVLPKVEAIAKGDYHPAARVNAVQIMNWLDIRPYESGNLPQPSRQALGKLVSLINDANTPEYLVATALAGIQRHAKIDGQLPSDRMPTAARNAIVDAAINLVTKYQNNRRPDQAGYLISRRAVQILDDLNLAANDPKSGVTKTALEEVAQDGEAGPWLRMDAMAALAQMPLDDATAFVKDLGQLVTLVAKMERQQMVKAQELVKLKRQIDDKTGAAEAKKKNKSAADRERDLGVGAGSGSMSLGQGAGMSGAGGAGGMFGGLNQADLMPFHLRYVRTNVKLAASAAEHILGTQDKAKTGLRFVQTVRGDAQLMQLINDVDKQLKALKKSTDIGLVEEKEISRTERLRMPAEKRALLDQPPIVRVLSEIGFQIRDLESLVGKVELAGDEEAEKAVEATTAAAIEQEENGGADASLDPPGEAGAEAGEDDGSTGPEGGDPAGPEGGEPAGGNGQS